MGVELWATSGSRVRLAIDGRRRAISRELGGGEVPSFLDEFSSLCTDYQQIC